MAASIRNYFTCANSSKGFVNLFDSNIRDLDRLYILKGGPGTGKSSLMKHIAQEWNERGLEVELIHCSSDRNSLDGIIIPRMRLGIVDGTAPHIIEPKAPGAVENYINLGEAWDSRMLANNKDAIMNINQEISECYQNTYRAFADALKIHDEWEKIYIENMDFIKADKITNETIKTIIGSKTADKSSTIKHRFFGGATHDGPVDYIYNLTEDITHRYFIKGRPGSGKSTMLKKIASAAEKRGFDMEIYHCGFDPDSLDMLVIRELNSAIFDSTAPHEYFPERENDVIIDMYSGAISNNTDEIYKDEISDIAVRYKEKMSEGITYLKKAKILHDQLEKYYIEAMNFSIVDKIVKKTMKEIEEFYYTNIL